VTNGPTIPQIRAGLVAAAEPSSSTPIHAQALRGWLLDDHERQAKLSEIAVRDFGAGGGRSVAHVATLGYVEATGRLASQLQPVLDEGLAWLGERAWFRPHHPHTLEADGVAALGVALALHSRASTEAGWMQRSRRKEREVTQPSRY